MNEEHGLIGINYMLEVCCVDGYYRLNFFLFRKVQGCYWMVDHRENFSRMRLKLARLRNWNYDRHAEASVKRDKGGIRI